MFSAPSIQFSFIYFIFVVLFVLVCGNTILNLSNYYFNCIYNNVCFCMFNVCWCDCSTLMHFPIVYCMNKRLILKNSVYFHFTALSFLPEIFHSEIQTVVSFHIALLPGVNWCVIAGFHMKRVIKSLQLCRKSYLSITPECNGLFLKSVHVCVYVCVCVCMCLSVLCN